jgi:hypothetical protein
MVVPKYNPRRPYWDDEELGNIDYRESDQDYFANNRELILYLLAPFEEAHDDSV